MRCLSHPNSHIRILFQNWANLTQFAPYASHLSQYQHALLEPYQLTHPHPHDHVYPPPHPHTHPLTNTPTQPHSSHITHLFSPYYHTSSSPHPVTPHTHTHIPHHASTTTPIQRARPNLPSPAVLPHTQPHTHTTIPTYHHSSHTTPTHATRPRDIHPQPSLRPSPTRYSAFIFGRFGCN